MRTIIVMVMLLSCMFAVVLRNRIWRDDFTLWDNVILQSTQKTRGYNNAASAQLRHGRVQEAIRIYEQTLSGGRRNEEAANNLAIIYLDKGEYDKAIAYAMQGIAADGSAYNTLGEIYMKTQQFEMAFDFFKKAIAINPSEYTRYYNAALALERLGRPEDACAYWKSFVLHGKYKENMDDVMAHMQELSCQ